jgi:transcriptional regulator with XRE-family HTH domain
VPRPILEHQKQLADRLADLRTAGGFAGAEFARHLGWQQSRVSKIETGTQLATEDDVEAWARGLGLGKDVRRELVALLRLAESEYLGWRKEFLRRGGGAGIQKALRTRDLATKVTRQLVLGIVPGLLQTPAYARDVITSPGGPGNWNSFDQDALAQMLEERLKRQGVLREPGREWRYVFAEAVLWTRYGSADTLVGQLRHLVATMEELPAVDIRVVPFSATWPIFPMATFKIHDEMTVSLEQQVGEHVVSDPRQVQAYIEQWDLLAGVALNRRQSMALIQQVADRIC